MKLVRHGAPGQERPGILDPSGSIRDLSIRLDDADVKALDVAALEWIAHLDLDELPTIDPETRLGPCLGGVGKIVGVGLNYRSHADEAEMTLPDEPLLFLKPTSAISGPSDPILLPPDSTTTDYEIELGVVIGRTATRIQEGEARSHVAGYCIVNDVTERTWQLHRGGTWDKGKAHDNFAPIGPWFVTADEIPDPHDLTMCLTIDGETRQHANTSDMNARIDQVVAYISQFMTLHPGDLITTGTPSGTALGTADDRYLQPGDLVTATIDGLGTQNTPVVSAPVHETSPGLASPVIPETVRGL